MSLKVPITAIYNDLNNSNLPISYVPFVFFHKTSETQKHIDLMIKIGPCDKISSEVDIRWDYDDDNREILVYTFTVVTDSSHYDGYSIGYIDHVIIENPDGAAIDDDTPIIVNVTTLPASNDVQGTAVVRYGDIP